MANGQCCYEQAQPASALAHCAAAAAPLLLLLLLPLLLLLLLVIHRVDMADGQCNRGQSQHQYTLHSPLLH
jgi:hypothetical protein